MTAHATSPSGAQRNEFLPYVYGATLGRPSRGRPELVLANPNRPESAVRLMDLQPSGAPGASKQQRTTTRKQEEKVGNGRIDGREGHVTARNAVPGGHVRNGLPEPRGYVYRGTGKDTLTAHMNGRRLEREAEEAIRPRTPAEIAADAERLALLEGELAARGVVDAESAPEPPRAPDAPAAKPAASNPRRRRAAEASGQDRNAPEPGQLETRVQAAVRPADTPSPETAPKAEPEPVAQPEPAATPPAAAAPAPARRHRKCGYPVGSIGCRNSCGVT